MQEKNIVDNLIRNYYQQSWGLAFDDVAPAFLVVNCIKTSLSNLVYQKAFILERCLTGKYLRLV